MFTEDNGDRESVPNFAVVITDGESTVNKERTLPEAREARISGIHIIAVAVGPNRNKLELKGIASDPDDKNIFSVDSFDNLETIQYPVISSMCNGGCHM